MMSDINKFAQKYSDEHVQDTKDEQTHFGNEKAFKGDDSDGSVNWTPRTVLAAIALGCLYTGMRLGQKSFGPS